MKEIMTIADVLEFPGRGYAIGGVNPSLDERSADEIRALVGDEIEVHAGRGDVYRVRVVDVQVTNSIADKKNIFVLVPMDVDKSRLRVGAKVLAE